MSQAFWDKKILKYASEPWARQPTYFSAQAIKYFPKKGSVLELGAGLGEDSSYFQSRGHKVIAADFSSTSIKALKSKKLPYRLVNLSKTLPFANRSFDAVYAHLSLHYLNEEQTTKMFAEIYRVLKPNGILAFIVNSTADPELTEGKRLEKYYVELGRGNRKRFFNLQETKKFTQKFTPILLDAKGRTRKDPISLIRFIGRKPGMASK